jgi:hypothetical protein
VQELPPPVVFAEMRPAIVPAPALVGVARPGPTMTLPVDGDDVLTGYGRAPYGTSPYGK